MDDLILPRQHPDGGGKQEPLLTEISPPKLPAAPTAPASTTAEEEVLAALRSSPSQETVSHSLQLLLAATTTTTTGLSAQTVRVLLETTVTDWWHVLPLRERSLLARCLSSPTGLGGLAARLKALAPLAAPGPGPGAGDAAHEALGNMLALLQLVLGRVGFVWYGWALVRAHGGSDIARLLLWKEFVALVAGGRLLAAAAQAQLALGRAALASDELWVGNGKLYALWLGRETARATRHVDRTAADSGAADAWKALAALLTGSFRLGYTGKCVWIVTGSDAVLTRSALQDHVVAGLTHKLRHGNGSDQDDNEDDGKDGELRRLQKLVGLLPVHDKRTFAFSLLRVVSAEHLGTARGGHDDGDDSDDSDGSATGWWRRDAARVAGAAALLAGFVLHDDDVRALVLAWLTATAGGGVGEPLGLRRALVAVIAQDELALRTLLEELLQQFADKLWIARAPIVRQEGRSVRPWREGDNAQAAK